MRFKINHSLRALLFFLCLAVLFPAGAGAAETGKISGIIFTLGSDGVMTTWPGANVTLKNQHSQAAFSTVANDRGEYSFAGVAEGEYELTIALAGFEKVVRTLKLEPKADLRIDVRLSPSGQHQQVEVKAEVEGVEIAPTVQAGPEITSKVLESVPLVDNRFQDALPLIPGVVRGPDGSLNIKGGRGNQNSTLMNSSNVGDPVTGQPVIELPIAAIQSVRVLASPFSAEYGQFAGGVVELETKSGTDQWKFSFDEFIPRPRYRSGHFIGIEDIEPRMVLAGPLKTGKLYLYLLADYHFNRTKVFSQPDLRNDLVTESTQTIGQLDWNVTANNRLTGMAWVYPRYAQFVGLNTFNAEAVTPNSRSGGYMISLRERAIFSQGGFLESIFSARRLDDHIYPSQQTSSEMTLFPEANSGSYFSTRTGTSYLYQWGQTYHERPRQAHGTHLVEVGYSYAHSSSTAKVSNKPVLVLREDNTLSQMITYSPAATLAADLNEFTFFIQDRWQIHPRVSLDLGVRMDREDNSRDPLDVAPRVAFVFAPGRDNKTAIRGGVGLFYDKIPLNVSTFTAYPAQTVLRYAADSITIVDGPTTFVHSVDAAGAKLHIPYSLSWNFQIDHELPHRLIVRFGYEERQTYRDLIIEPVELPPSAMLLLRDAGRQSYREFQVTLRWEPAERTRFFTSYTRARAEGDLNGFDQFFGNYPNPIVRANQRSLLPYDVPNRFLFWGYAGLPWKFQLSPVLELRDGFPFSKWDSDLNYIGVRDKAGRFPVFVALNVQVSRPLIVHYHHRNIQLKPSFRFLNVTNHDNPRDVQQNVSSPNFQALYNSVARQFRVRLDFELLGKN